MYHPFKFTSDLFPNLTLEVNGNGVLIKVSLNITPAMRKFLSSNNVYKSNKFYVYMLKKQVERLDFITLKKVYDVLLTRAMIQCREAKKKVLKEQQETIMINYLLKQ